MSEYSKRDREVVREVMHLLEGQVIGIEHPPGNWIIHEPFWAIAMHFFPEESRDD